MPSGCTRVSLGVFQIGNKYVVQVRRDGVLRRKYFSTADAAQTYHQKKLCKSSRMASAMPSSEKWTRVSMNVYQLRNKYVVQVRRDGVLQRKWFSTADAAQTYYQKKFCKKSSRVSRAPVDG